MEAGIELNPGDLHMVCVRGNHDPFWFGNLGNRRPPILQETQASIIAQHDLSNEIHVNLRRTETEPSSVWGQNVRDVQ